MVSKWGFEKPSVGRTIIFMKWIFGRLSVAVVARKVVHPLCDSKEVLFISYVFKRGIL